MNGRKEYYCYHVAVVAVGRGSELKKISKVGEVYEASHTCKNKSCYNPDHVAVEPQEVNRSRERCQIAACKHTPKCIN